MKYQLTCVNPHDFKLLSILDCYSALRDQSWVTDGQIDGSSRVARNYGLQPGFLFCLRSATQDLVMYGIVFYFGVG